jgi:hypothetical protein
MSYNISEIRVKVGEVLCDYEEDLRSLVSGLLSEVDQKPIQVVHEAVNALDSGYRNFERKLYACFPEMAKRQETSKPEENADREPEEHIKYAVIQCPGIKRPRLPKFSSLSEKEKENVLKAKLDFAAQTRNMPLSEIKAYMPGELKRVYPYSTVYHHFTRPLLQKLESSGIRTPASMADIPFSQIKALAQSQDPSVGNVCLKAFMDIYGMNFAPEKTTLF